MPAYMREIHKPQCGCGKPATHEVKNWRNEHIGFKCSSCAKRLVKQLNDAEMP